VTVVNITPDPVLLNNLPKIQAQFDAGAMYNGFRKLAMENNVVLVTATQEQTPFATELVLGNERLEDGCKDLQLRILKSRKRQD
jgi:hypothetical protein